MGRQRSAIQIAKRRGRTNCAGGKIGRSRVLAFWNWQLRLGKVALAL